MMSVGSWNSITETHLPKIFAKIKIYVLIRAELLFKVCHEIPCRFLHIMSWQHYFILCKQGVLASKFPISILTRIQGQHECQIFSKTVQNYVSISYFDTRLLNLRKPKKLWKKCFFLNNANCSQLFQCTFFVHSQYLLYKKYFFNQKLVIQMSLTIKLGLGGKIWDFTPFCWIFDTYVDPDSTLIY